MNIFLRCIFAGMKSWTTWYGNVIAQSPRKMALSSELFQRFIVVYRTSIGVNFHLFIICYYWLCYFPLKRKKTFRHNWSTFLVRCAVVLLLAKWSGWSTQISRHRSSDWDNIGLSCRLNHLNKHSRWDEWQDKVSFCLLIRFNWRVPARVPLFSLGL